METKENNFIDGGHISDPAAALYVDSLLQDDLSPLPGEVLEHVEACPGCKDKILDLFLFLKNPDSAEAVSTQEKIVALPQRRVRRFYARKAAAVFFICALVLTAYFLIYKGDFFSGRRVPADKGSDVPAQVTENREESRGEAAGQGAEDQKAPGVETSGKASRYKLPPVNYRVNPNLENMIGSQSRGEVVQVHSPLNNVDLKYEILFSWEEIKLKQLRLKILDNRSEILFDYPVKGNRVVFKERLSPGLYYWKLESQHDLLYVGKFFIR